jgi:hypothetical protein
MYHGNIQAILKLERNLIRKQKRGGRNGTGIAKCSWCNYNREVILKLVDAYDISVNIF